MLKSRAKDIDPTDLQFAVGLAVVAIVAAVVVPILVGRFSRDPRVVAARFQRKKIARQTRRRKRRDRALLAAATAGSVGPRAGSGDVAREALLVTLLFVTATAELLELPWRVFLVGLAQALAGAAGVVWRERAAWRGGVRAAGVALPGALCVLLPFAIGGDVRVDLAVALGVGIAASFVIAALEARAAQKSPLSAGLIATAWAAAAVALGGLFALVVAASRAA